MAVGYTDPTWKNGSVLHRQRGIRSCGLPVPQAWQRVPSQACAGCTGCAASLQTECVVDKVTMAVSWGEVCCKGVRQNSSHSDFPSGPLKHDHVQGFSFCIPSSIARDRCVLPSPDHYCYEIFYHCDIVGISSCSSSDKAASVSGHFAAKMPRVRLSGRTGRRCYSPSSLETQPYVRFQAKGIF